MKVHEVIKRLQDNYSPDDDIIVTWWDYEAVMDILETTEYYPEDSRGFVEKWEDKKLTKEEFSDLAEDIEHYTELYANVWNLVSEYFSDIYENWKEV